MEAAQDEALRQILSELMVNAEQQQATSKKWAEVDTKDHPDWIELLKTEMEPLIGKQVALMARLKALHAAIWPEEENELRQVLSELLCNDEQHEAISQKHKALTVEERKKPRWYESLKAELFPLLDQKDALLTRLKALHAARWAAGSHSTKGRKRRKTKEE